MIRTRRIPGGYRAFVYAVLVHVAVVAIVIVGFRWTSNSAVSVGQPVQAVAVEDPQQRKLEEEEKQRRADEKRRAEEDRKQQEEEARRAEARRLEQQKQEAEKQRQAEAKRKQQEEAEKKKQAEAKRKQDEERKQQAEAEKKRQEAESRKVAEDSLKQQIAAEEQARAEAARAARAATEAEKYKILIKQKVSRNWNRPAGARTGLKCVVRVRLAPGGDVLQANVVRSSGDGVFDRSVENAVYKAAPLPLPADPDLFDYFRDIEFLFNPEG